MKSKNIEEVIKIVKKISKIGLEKIELIDKEILNLANIKSSFADKIINSQYKYIILLSLSEKLEKKLNYKINIINNNFYKYILNAKNQKEFDDIFKLRKTAASYIHKQRFRKKPIPVIEDLQVDLEKIDIFITGIKKILNTFSVDFFLFGHIGNGNIHINTFFDILEENDRIKALNLKSEIHNFVISINGILSAEHGDGKLRSQDLKKSYPKLYPIFKEIKYFFDKDNIFNPNNIIDESNYNYFDNLRLNSIENYNVPIFFDEYFYISEIEACNGCGKCRDFCPSFFAKKEEKYSSRARMNLFQGLIDSSLSLYDLKSKEGKEVLDSCIACHICATQCPTGIDIGKLVLKFKNEVKTKVPLNKKIINNQKYLSIAQKTSPLSNKILKNNVVKSLNKKFLSISDKIELPEFNKHKLNLSDYMINEKDLKSFDNAVIYYMGCFANYYNTEDEFLSTIKVLEYFKFKPYIMNFKCCGVSKINSSISIKKDSDINVKLFNSISKFKIPIVFSAPTCLQTIEKLYPFVDRKRDYSYLNNVFDIFTFLKNNVKFDNIKKINKNLQYHPPCHTRDYSIDEDIKFVLEKFYKNVELLARNCCGMAGSFGIFKENIIDSQEIAKKQMNLIENNKKDLITPCGTCKLQIKNQTSVKVTHPIKYLYEAIKII